MPGVGQSLVGVATRVALAGTERSVTHEQLHLRGPDEQKALRALTLHGSVSRVL
jgi:hypothetical protein